MKHRRIELPLARFPRHLSALAYADYAPSPLRQASQGRSPLSRLSHGPAGWPRSRPTQSTRARAPAIGRRPMRPRANRGLSEPCHPPAWRSPPSPHPPGQLPSPAGRLRAAHMAQMPALSRQAHPIGGCPTLLLAVRPDLRETVRRSDHPRTHLDPRTRSSPRTPAGRLTGAAESLPFRRRHRRTSAQHHRPSPRPDTAVPEASPRLNQAGQRQCHCAQHDLAEATLGRARSSSSSSSA